MAPVTLLQVRSSPHGPNLRPEKTTFDSAYEHSLDRLLEVRKMVEEEDTSPRVQAQAG